MICSETTSGNDTHVNGTVSEEFHIDPLWVILGFLAASIATSISMVNIFKHLANYTRPDLQKSLVRIIFIVPVYSASCLSLAFPEYNIVVESIRDCWEAVVIYEFLRLILAYCGGESACLQVLMKDPGSINHLFPFNYCFSPLLMDSRFMRLTKQYTLQFVFVKPVMAIVNIAMFFNCTLDDPVYYMCQLIVYNLSYTLSLYGLLLFYFATHHHPGLSRRKPLLKFLGVKLVVFATYYQGLLVQLIPNMNRHLLEALNSFIFCIEMVFFSLFYLWAFGWFEYVKRENEVGLGDEEDFDPATIVDHDDHNGDIELNPAVKNVKILQQGVKEVLNMEDVVSDARENFSSKYQNHVRLDTTSKNDVLDQLGLEDTQEEEEDKQRNPFQAAEETARIQQLLNTSSTTASSSLAFPPPAAAAKKKQVNPFLEEQE